MAHIRVVLIDDHPIMRAGICELLEQAPDVVIVGEASDDAEALRLVEEMVPDVALLDMEMLDLAGVEIARQLQTAGSPTHVLALSAYDDAEYIFELLAMGVAGYLAKEEAPEMIVEAVHRVAQGEQGWLSRRVVSRMAAWARKKRKSERFWLTEHELEVLQQVAWAGQAAVLPRIV